MTEVWGGDSLIACTCWPLNRVSGNPTQTLCLRRTNSCTGGANGKRVDWMLVYPLHATSHLGYRCTISKALSPTLSLWSLLCKGHKEIFWLWYFPTMFTKTGHISCQLCIWSHHVDSLKSATVGLFTPLTKATSQNVRWPEHQWILKIFWLWVFTPREVSVNHPQPILHSIPRAEFRKHKSDQGIPCKSVLTAFCLKILFPDSFPHSSCELGSLQAIFYPL